jgi:hypothetical protein
MYRQGIADFPYYLGTKSLAEVATRADRVCVLNILGGESRTVTPTSHASPAATSSSAPRRGARARC